MSFVGHKELIEAGDTVVVHVTTTITLTVEVRPGEVLKTRYGELPHSKVIGAKYGAKFQLDRGWLHVLHPTPELWATHLPHRYRVLGYPDISMILLQLDLKPGSVVVESGKAATSLSHALIRTVQPEGHVYLFEEEEEEAKRMEEALTKHSIKNHITVQLRDVCKQGFDVRDVADAVFLDVEEPWMAIQSAKQALKTQGGRFCSFSLNIEKVQKTCEALKQHGFCDVKTFECTEKGVEVNTVHLGIPYLGFDQKPTETQDCGESTVSKKPRTEEEVEMGEEPVEMGEEPVEMGEEQDDEGQTEGGAEDFTTKDDFSGEEITQPEESADIIGDECVQDHALPERKKGKPRDYYLNLVGIKEGRTFSFHTEERITRVGHTGFLTFATLYPAGT